ncbi:radical SAM family heme chaperone HemW [Candidatus Babeliales bacterium]|nr:radical SAM family heme chaperone HemW [Candidatus Babeliales bacterium]
MSIQNKCSQHLYIHWPFCKNKCHYCDFVSFAKHEKYEQQYHKALCTEIKSYVSKLSGPRKIKTIFFGGGTPSLYPIDLLTELFVVLKNNFDLSDAEEITIEVNPKEVTEKQLSTWRFLGINRLSIGVQVLDDKILANLNRIQTNKDVYSLIEKAFKYFDNVSVDLILGLPGITDEVWNNTLKQIVKWPIKHISVYMLMVHDRTPLSLKLSRGDIKLLSDDEFVDIYDGTVKFLDYHGFKQYELSNFAVPGFESEHNRAYWDHRPYRGFGLSAASFEDNTRFVNLKKLMHYLDIYLLEGELKYSFQEKLGPEQLRMEQLMLGLRQSSGMDLHAMLYLFKEGEQERLSGRLDDLKNQGLIVVENGRVRLALKGMALENEVILSLLSN